MVPPAQQSLTPAPEGRDIDMSTTITRMSDAVRRSAERRRTVRRLEDELTSFRTPAERAELEALLERHETSVPELLRQARAAA